MSARPDTRRFSGESRSFQYSSVSVVLSVLPQTSERAIREFTYDLAILR